MEGHSVSFHEVYTQRIFNICEYKETKHLMCKMNFTGLPIKSFVAHSLNSKSLFRLRIWRKINFQKSETQTFSHFSFKKIW